MENVEKRVIRISRKKLIITIVIIVIMFILGCGIFLFNSTRYYSLSNNTGNIMTPSVPGVYNEDSNSYRNQNNTLSINDTREFMKTSYDTTIQTRNVKSVLRDVKGSIKVANGRIDQLNENTKSGYVRFVIPKINFENFKDEITSITNEKLIIENISSSNLLNQKQSIEQQQQNVNDSLSRLQQKQKDLLSKHNQTKNNLQNQITNLENTLYMMDPGPMGFSSEDISYRQSISNEIAQKKQQISSENSTYNTNYQNLKNQVDVANNQLLSVAKQDSNFTDNIETVNGSIRVEWVSVWQLLKIFSPIHPTFIIIILVIIIWYFLKRKNYLPKVELV
ncbi:MAG: hypothetical protein WCG45_03450 [bacterium]